MTAYVAVDSLVKRYDQRPVLQSISLEVERSELIALLGPSGCGKTTLLRLLAGFERPDAGAVLLEGADITHVPARERNMGMVFQAYSLFPNLSAEENVRFGLRVRKAPQPEQRRRAAEMLELVGLSDHQHKFPHQLSGGQQQRVALARALAIEPALLLLDEPLSALDAKVRAQLRQEIRRIQREREVTTVFVTHDQEEALSMADRVAVMRDGRFMQVAEPAQIYRDPANAFVARFIGAAVAVPGQVSGDGRSVQAGDLVLGLGEPMPAGQEVTAFLRPEDLQVHTPEATDAPPSNVPVTVRDRVFFGSITRLHLVTDGGVELHADLPSSRAERFRYGERVRVSWPAQAPRVLAE